MLKLSNDLSVTQFCTGYAKWPEWSQENNISISFGKDEGIIGFDRGLLEQIPYFKSQFTIDPTRKHFELEQFTTHDIRLLCSLFHDMWDFSSAVQEDFLTTPNFYVHLEKMIDFFMGDEAGTAKCLIAEQMQGLPYETALALMKNFYMENGEASTLPYFLEIAQEVVGTKALFSSEHNFKDYLYGIRKLHCTLLDVLSECVVTMMALKQAKEENSVFDKVVYIHKRTDNSTFSIDFFEKLLNEKLYSVWKSNSNLMKLHKKKTSYLKPSQLYDLSHRKVSLENVAEYCETAFMKRAWKIYKAKLFNNLQYQTSKKPAQMHRSEFLCAKLFAHYDLEIAKEDNPYFPPHKVLHRNPSSKGGFIYYFDYPEEADLRALENEIRTDLGKYGKLPERLFPEDASLSKAGKEKEIDFSMIDLKAELLPFFSSKLSSSEKEFLAKKMISMWGWDKYGINPEDVCFDPLPNCDDKDKVRVTGTLKKKLRFNESVSDSTSQVSYVQGGEYEYEFYFNLCDFKPIILDRMIACTPEGTSQFLECYFMKKWKFEFYQKEQMIWPLHVLKHIGLKECIILNAD